jgi:hypothetical protein
VQIPVIVNTKDGPDSAFTLARKMHLSPPLRRKRWGAYLVFTDARSTEIDGNALKCGLSPIEPGKVEHGSWRE